MEYKYKETIITINKLNPGITELLKNYKILRKIAKHFNEIADHHQCMIIMQSHMDKKQIHDFEDHVENNPIESGFCCGACGSEEKMLIIYGKKKKERYQSSYSIKNIADMLKKSFKNDVDIVIKN